ncbi:hypothetical protein DPMN_003973 [Dreissena polymorpha]|uniref:Uncharacterized protein n=1 Tax=Dreissena polymorpha TaxID=45954 RepID=A0A9D4MQW7_DREPO|nr:hypothetical protein DPMN_003973 [Dreissena polymorpha]
MTQVNLPTNLSHNNVLGLSMKCENITGDWKSCTGGKRDGQVRPILGFSEVRWMTVG